jgi:hypothetical protein
VAGEQAHLADGGLGVPAAEVVLRGEPGGGAGVAVGVVAVVVEPPQQPVGRRAQRPPRMRLLRLTHAGLPASPCRLSVRRVIIKSNFDDLLFDFMSLRHRQDIELKRAGHGPFDKTGLIWPCR